jgi:hypothetical protein
MNIVDLILKEDFAKAKESIRETLDTITAKRLQETKVYLAFEIEDEELEESTNVVRMGRVNKIRRRIRRNKKGKIIVQRNVRRSALKGYRLVGNTVRRIPAVQRIQKARKLKRYWKTKGRAKLRRVLLKRRMSIRRRQSMGIK